MRQGNMRLTLCAICLLVTCSLGLASERAPTSPAPSMLKLTEAEIVSMLGPEGSYSVPEIATIVLELQVEARAEIRRTSEEAAAAGVRPVLVELAGVTAERDAYRSQLRTWRTVAVIAGVLAFAAGVGVGVLAGR